jgi:hypothetical protein
VRNDDAVLNVTMNYHKLIIAWPAEYYIGRMAGRCTPSRLPRLNSSASSFRVGLG